MQHVDVKKLFEEADDLCNRIRKDTGVDIECVLDNQEVLFYFSYKNIKKQLQYKRRAFLLCRVTSIREKLYDLAYEFRLGVTTGKIKKSEPLIIPGRTRNLSIQFAAISIGFDQAEKYFKEFNKTLKKSFPMIGTMEFKREEEA